jgi:hypothetical protein
MAAPKSKTAGFQPSGDTKRVISCGGGRWLRIGDHEGKWHHLSVERDPDEIHALVHRVADADRPLADRIVAELLALDPVEFVYVTLEAES